MPLVSAIIPAFNAASFVADAIESALRQTHRPLEVIVVDDGSTDRTPDVLAGFGSAIDVVRQTNMGLAGARNQGARHARGEWLAFLDADDVWMPEKIEKQLERARSGAAMVYTDRENIGELDGLPRIQSEIEVLVEGDAFVQLLTGGNVIPASSAMVRQQVFRDLGGFYPARRSGAEDWDLWVRLAAQHDIAVCREPLVKYRLHAGAMTRNVAQMTEASTAVVERALASPRGRLLPRRVRRQILARVHRSNAARAARYGNQRHALVEYLRSIRSRPLAPIAYIDVIRMWGESLLGGTALYAFLRSQLRPLLQRRR